MAPEVVGENRESGAKGIMKMRTIKSEQLSMVFADSPKGNQGEEALALPSLHVGNLPTIPGGSLPHLRAALLAGSCGDDPPSC